MRKFSFVVTFFANFKSSHVRFHIYRLRPIFALRLKYLRIIYTKF